MNNSSDDANVKSFGGETRRKGIGVAADRTVSRLHWCNRFSTTSRRVSLCRRGIRAVRAIFIKRRGSQSTLFVASNATSSPLAGTANP